MTRLILFTFFTICFSITSNSQCSETAFNFGNNSSTPRYNIQGDVSLTLNADNTITLNLANNFSTAFGPDVRAYLINSNEMSNATLKSTKIADIENIHFGKINSSGEQSFTIEIPENIKISDYDKIFFYCLDFDVFWDVGSFNSFTNATCNVLSVENFNASNITIHPNPATTSIELSNIDTTNAEIHIFDFYGKSVFKQKNNINTTINVSTLTSGTYFVVIHENQKTFSKKLIIQ